MGHSINAGLDMLKIRKSLPKELEREFVTFKDIACIDRIQASAWMGFVLTLCLFGLDILRYKNGEILENPYYLPLFYFHLLGILFIVPAIHITLHKKRI